MKKYPKIVQVDQRGQIVIPKDIRSELNIDEGSGFYMFSISDEGILLKKIPDKELEGDEIVKKIEEKAEKIGIKKQNIKKSVQRYKKTKKGRLEII